MSIIDIKFTKFDNTPWGFRLVGGSDFPQPLTVIKVAELSLAECMGLKVGDVVVRLNDRPVANLTHGQAHEALVLAGNNFTLGVHRKQDALEAFEAIQSENIVPYTIPLEELKPVYPIKELSYIPIEPIEQNDCHEEEVGIESQSEEKPAVEEETIIDKPVDENSEVVPNKNLTDDEIAQLILEEEELLAAGDQAVLGVNFNKLRPRAPQLRESKVLQQLQSIALEEPPKIQELKHKSTFLQKPERPIPVAKKSHEDEEIAKSEGYRVIIKKQMKKSVTERLLEKGLLEPGSDKVQTETTTEMIVSETRVKTPDVNQSRPESKTEIAQNDDNTKEEVKSESCKEDNETNNEDNDEDNKESECNETPCFDVEPTPPVVSQLISAEDKEKIKELVTTELSLEKQLENVQNQLMALKQLPSEIENHLKIVSEQLHKIMELSGIQNGSGTSSRRASSDQESKSDNRVENECTESVLSEDTANTEENQREAITPSTEISETTPIINEPDSEMLEEIEPPETKELEVTLKDAEDHRVKKCVASYETRVFRSTPSPAPSHGSYEPDTNLPLKDQLIQELKHKGGRKRSQDLWPQAKQLELTYGRRWRCPNDFFNDEMIAEVLSGQAEVIRGRALGVNFKKYEKEYIPNYDHLMNSSVYKMLHKVEREPKTGIPARPPKVPAAQDIIERVKTPA